MEGPAQKVTPIREEDSPSAERWAVIWTCISVVLVIIPARLYYVVKHHDITSSYDHGNAVGYEGEGALGGVLVCWIAAIAGFGLAALTSFVGTVFVSKAIRAQQLRDSSMVICRILNLVILCAAIMVLVRETWGFWK
jgi:hypothetical protein